MDGVNGIQIHTRCSNKIYPSHVKNFQTLATDFFLSYSNFLEYFTVLSNSIDCQQLFVWFSIYVSPIYEKWYLFCLRV